MLLCCITLSSSRKTNASSRRSKKDFWRRCRGSFHQVKTYQVPITNSSPSHLHYLPFASRFPLPHFTLAVLFALSFPISSLSFACLLLPCFCFTLCLKLGRLSSIWTTMITWKILMLLLKKPPSCILKSFELVLVILLEKGFFKTTLLQCFTVYGWFYSS